jgi:aspartyl-tRNA(Asn)/glutamyl-tRNA(Gln) amidotransferase subunit C
MNLDGEHLDRLAALARLRIDAAEAAGLRQSLEQILALAETLQQVPTEGVEPLANPLDAVQPLRADEVTEADRRGDFQAIAPSVERGLYLVPRVVE